MTASLDFVAELQRLAHDIEKRITAERSDRLAAIPYEARLWLAVTPAWTFPLAEAVDFPRDARGLDALVEAMDGERLCELERALPGSRGEHEPRFWMPASERESFIAEASRSRGAGALDIGHVIGEIGGRIERAAPTLPPGAVPPLVRRWARLARHAPSAAMIGQALEREIDGCLGARRANGERQRPEEALEWIDAARPLGDVLGDAVTAAIRQQGRRVDLVYRRREDRRAIEHFLLRDEPHGAFRRLIEGPDDRWALHFVGAGGVGKTMLMRWISGRWSEENDRPTARIDFDYLNPEFPTRAPALLLAQLMQDLRLHANESADRSFGSFESWALAMHEQARAMSTATASGPLPNFSIMLDTFAEAVKLLGRPVVLLLDTCEELAKARVASAGLPDNVRATFDILEALHERLPSLRVVFCGRRPLASRGAGWALPGSKYPPRDYLMLHELRGFTRAEALQYLSRENVPAPIVAPIVRVSEDGGDRMGFFVTEVEVAPAGAPADDDARFAPFNLSLYARWAREDPALSADVILAGDTDPYIETRVLGRVRRPALRELVPVMALVGRFDEALLRAVSTRTKGELEEAIGELREQDWIREEEPGTFEVKGHLRPRLLAYLERTGRTVLSGVRARAIDHLVRATTELPFEQLSVAHFESAAVLLANDAARAADWWDRIETRFGASADLAWARALVERLLSDEGPAGERDDTPDDGPHPLRAAILATYASVLAQADQPERLDAIWNEVEALRGSDVRRGGPERLLLRACAGRLVSARASDAFVSGDQVVAFLRALDAVRHPMSERIAAQGVAGYEALVELAEVELAMGPASWHPSLGAFAATLEESGISPELTAFAASLAARTARVLGDHAETDRWWRAALAAAAPLGGPTRQRWIDWRAPAELRTRLHLEYARGEHAAMTGPAAVLATIGDEVRPPRTVDADRLDSAVLALRGAIGPPALSDARSWASADEPWPARAERCNAHRETPPLHAAYWEAEALAYGQVDAALDALGARVAAAERSAASGSVYATQLALLHIARRMRLRDEERVADSLGYGGGDANGVAAMHAMLAFDARERPSVRVPAATSAMGDAAARGRLADALHLLWRSIPATTADGAAFAIEWANTNFPLPGALGRSYASVACLLDAVEANALAERHRLGLPFPELGAPGGAIAIAGGTVDEWLAANALRREATLRLHLRADALGSGGESREREIERLVRSCGMRRAAVIALDEGELLALRLPDAGVRLLRRAGGWFRGAMDPVGDLVATACRALAAVRAADGDGLDAALAEAMSAYELVTRNRPTVGLPPPPMLRDIAEEPTDRAMHDLSPPAWRPWLVRLVAALAWQRDGGTLGPRGAGVGRWITLTYGNVSIERAGVVGLPPELAPWAPAAREISSEIARTTETPVSEPTMWLRVESGERRSFAPGTGTRFRIVVEGADGSASEELSGALARAPQVLDEAAHSFAGAGRLAARWREAGRPRRIELVVDAGASAACWEGLLSRWLAENGARPALRMLRRPPETRGHRTPPAWREVSSVVSHVGDASLARLVSRAWEPASHGDAAGVEVELRFGFALGSPGGALVVHVVGTPVQTGRGDVALQMGQSSGGGSTVVYNQISPAGSRAASREGQLLRMRELREAYRSAVLVVLQANPTAGRERNAADRDCASFLRAMAAELASLGTPAVVTLPPVPAPDSVASLEPIARAVVRRDASMSSALLDAADESRRALREGTLLRPDDRDEAADDICLCLGREADTS